jgi:hypothetical protein
MLSSETGNNDREKSTRFTVDDKGRGKVGMKIMELTVLDDKSMR